MKAWQRRLQEAARATSEQRSQYEREMRAARIEQETAALVERVRAGKPSNAKTKRRMRALERLTGQKALTVLSTKIEEGHGIWIWRVEFSNGQVRTDYRHTKTSAEGDMRRAIQDMVGAS